MQKYPPTTPISMYQIRQEGFDLWMEYVAEVGKEYIFQYGMDFDEFYDAILYPKYEITLEKNEDLGFDNEGVPILGKYLPKENTALIDRKLFQDNDPRRTFTEIHETIGHGVLHGPYLRKHAKQYPKLYTTEDGIGFKVDGSEFNWKQMNTFEWQANSFAINSFAPRNIVYYMYCKIFDMERRIRFCGEGTYCLFCHKLQSRVYVRSPLQLAWIIAKRIQPYFGGLSAHSLAYQVLTTSVDCNGYDIGKLNEWGTTERIGEIFENYKQ